MRILCGTDIIEIERIKKSIERSGSNFLNLIYTPKEIEYCESTRNAKYCHYAGRFASKEAIFKTVSALLPDKFGISWKDVQIVNDENGNPKVMYDDPKRAAKAKDVQPKEEPAKQEEKCTTNTDNVDREIEKLKEEKKQLEQQIKAAAGDKEKVKVLEKKLAQIEGQLSQKDNDTYRRQNAVIS